MLITGRHPRLTLGVVKSSPKTTPRVVLLSEPLVGKMIALVLQHINAECRIVPTRQELRSSVLAWDPHVVLADLDLHPAAPGWMRVDGKEPPCVGFTRKREVSVKLDAFERGAYDVIEVPFTPDEIVVRTMATFRRAHGRTPALRPRAPFGPFEMDILEQVVRLDGTALRLTPLEQTLLYLFLAHPNEVLRREAILTNIWGQSSAVTSNVIDRHIRDLRVKLGERWRAPRFIETVPTEGYRYISK